VLGGVSAGLINELHGGWGWWVAAGGIVLATAGLTGWLAARTGGGGGDRLAAGAVKAGRDIGGPVRTATTRPPAVQSLSEVDGGDSLGPGAVKAGRDIAGGVTTNTTIGSDESAPSTRKRRRDS
jgi:hypothetical protein